MFAYTTIDIVSISKTLEILIANTLLVLYFVFLNITMVNKYCAEMHLIEVIGMFIVEPSYGVWQLVPDLSTDTDMTRLRHDLSRKGHR